MGAKNIYLFLIASSLILFSGCTRVMDWGTQTFYQGCKVEPCLQIPKEHIRTARVYDQFNTLGIFNAMWISDDVLKAYTNLYAEKYALNENAANDFLERHRNDNQGFISFFVLGYDPYECNGPLLMNRDKEIPWKIFLKIDDIAYEPYLIKPIEFKEEFKLFFGKLFTKFKTSYVVQFALDDLGDNLTLGADIPSLVLCFSSMTRKISMIWSLDTEGKLITDYTQYGECCCMVEPKQICEICKNAKLK